MGIIGALGDFPYSGDHPASLHFYDVDHRISDYGKRETLIESTRPTYLLGVMLCKILFLNLLFCYKPNLEVISHGTRSWSNRYRS